MVTLLNSVYKLAYSCTANYNMHVTAILVKHRISKISQNIVQKKKLQYIFLISLFQKVKHLYTLFSNAIKIYIILNINETQPAPAREGFPYSYSSH